MSRVSAIRPRRPEIATRCGNTQSSLSLTSYLQSTCRRGENLSWLGAAARSRHNLTAGHQRRSLGPIFDLRGSNARHAARRTVKRRASRPYISSRRPSKTSGRQLRHAAERLGIRREPLFEKDSSDILPMASGVGFDVRHDDGLNGRQSFNIQSSRRLAAVEQLEEHERMKTGAQQVAKQQIDDSIK